jgi:hypothetical protein
VASAAEQLSASIREIGAQVAQSTQVVVGRPITAGGEARATIEHLDSVVGLNSPWTTPPRSSPPPWSD